MIEAETIELGSQASTYSFKDLENYFPKNYLDVVTSYLYDLGLYTPENPPRFSDYTKTHPERKSAAHYLLEEDRGDMIIYVQFMPPNSKTSRHIHSDQVIEEFHVIFGKLFLDGFEIPKGGVVVEPDLYHPASTREEPTLSILVTRNVGGIPRNRLHLE